MDRRAILAGGAVYWPLDDMAVILVSPDLSRQERRAALGHELIHDERGGGADRPGMPPGWRAVVVRDEKAVNDELARRLVPVDDLARFVEARCSLDSEGGTAQDVADEFDVPVELAVRALRLLEEDWAQ